MPNWCNNGITLRHADSAMVQRAQEALARGEFLHEFIPVPLCLTETVAGSFSDPEKQAALEKSQQDNLNAYNYKNWYDFCVAEWGTKWDVGGSDSSLVRVDPNTLQASFDSAWAPPTRAYERLSEQGFEIEAMYYEPGMQFLGKWTGSPEEGFDDEYFEYGGETSETVREAIGDELDDYFGISEELANYEEEENQEIDLDGGLSATNE